MRISERQELLRTLANTTHIIAGLYSDHLDVVLRHEAVEAALHTGLPPFYIYNIESPLHPLNLLRDLLEVFSSLHDIVLEHRYLSRPLNKRLYVTQRDARFIQLLRDDSDTLFRQTFRVNRTCFYLLADEIRGNPVFHNNSFHEQADVHYQLAVALKRFGMDGVGVSVGQCSGFFRLSEGSVEMWTWRVIAALIDLTPRYIYWPQRQERRVLSSKLGRIAPFSGCVGFLDGTLIPFVQRPGVESADDYYCRKSFYGLNVQVVVDIDKRIRHLDVGWSGATNDQRVFDWSIVGVSILLSLRGLTELCVHSLRLKRQTSYPKASTFSPIVAINPLHTSSLHTRSRLVQLCQTIAYGSTGT